MFIPTVFSYSEVEDKITAKVTTEVTNKFQNLLQSEREKWALEIQQKESEIAAMDSEITKLRAVLESNCTALSFPLNLASMVRLPCSIPLSLLRAI